MHLPTYLTLLATAERTLATSYRRVAHGHADEADVRYTCDRFDRQCVGRAEALVPVIRHYQDRLEPEPDRLHPSAIPAARPGPVGLLRDLQDLYQLANLVDITWIMVGQAAAGARDRTLLDVVDRSGPEVAEQLAWLRTRMRAAAPQTLLVAP
ncbi:MAG TPA: hypothetical protein VGF17_09555 [Phytomonospora sp.]